MIKLQDWNWTCNDLPIPQKDFKFHNTKNWKFDFAFPELKIAIDIIELPNQQTNCLKYNSARKLGWIILRYPLKHINWKQIIELYNKKSTI